MSQSCNIFSAATEAYPLWCSYELLPTAAPSRTYAFVRALAASPAGATRAVCVLVRGDRCARCRPLGPSIPLLQHMLKGYAEWTDPMHLNA